VSNSTHLKKQEPGTKKVIWWKKKKSENDCKTCWIGMSCLLVCKVST